MTGLRIEAGEVTDRFEKRPGSVLSRSVKMRGWQARVFESRLAAYTPTVYYIIIILSP